MQRDGFGGDITSDLTAPGVTPDLTAPPKILTAPTNFEAPQNYRIYIFFFLANYPLLLYLVNHYFLASQ